MSVIDARQARTQPPVADDDRRRAPRMVVHHDVDCRNEDNYLLGSLHDISATGIFLRTGTPEAIGTRLSLRFAGANSTLAPLEVEGEVMWINPPRPGDPDSLHPGMGVRFVGLDAAQAQALTRFIARIAYLES